MHLIGPILGVWAHPDDECFLSAGLMVDASRNGQRVVCVTATRGELGIQEGSKELVIATRTAELEEALRILGVTEHHWLDYPDGGCAEVEREQPIARLSEIIAAVQPTTLLTFGPDGMTAHPDHIAVSEWTTEAFHRSAPEGSELLYATMTPEWADEWLPHLPDPSMIMMDPDADLPLWPSDDLAIAFRVPDDIFERKTRALRAHASQIGTMISIFGDPGAFEVNRMEHFRLGARR